MSDRVRLGTLYRLELLSHLSFGRDQNGSRVLDVGCHDGYVLSHLDLPVKVGIDLEPSRGLAGLNLVCGDGLFLPFQMGSFDQVYAMDVIEHVVDDRSFAAGLLRMLAPGGALLLTTPSRDIRLNPPFLTRWISHQWGHYYRLGYSRQELEQLFQHPDFEVKITPWSAPGYRFFYLVMRALYPVWPAAAQKILKWVSNWDADHMVGNRGYFILEARRRTRSQGSQGEDQESE
jgi:SAM-dependent methyltransferase